MGMGLDRRRHDLRSSVLQTDASLQCLRPTTINLSKTTNLGEVYLRYHGSTVECNIYFQPGE